MAWWRRILGLCLSGGIPCRSAITAAIVGTILNLINQGDTLWSGAHLNLAKLLLTYCVPFCVATFGAVSYRVAAERRLDPARRTGVK